MRKTQLFLGGLAAAAALAASPGAYSASVSAANLRSGPGPAWPVKGSIPAGTKVVVLNCGPGWSYSWCHVQAGRIKGYIHASALTPSGRKNVMVAPVVTTSAADLHRSPSLFSSVVAVVPAGAAVNLIRCKKGGGWCQVGYGRRTGYVRGGLLARKGGERIEFFR
jgi:uncharacterized protein YraI